MAKKDSYREFLKNEFSELIDTLELSDLQKRSMKSRWLDQLLWLEGKAETASKWSTRLRMCTIVGGVLIPALVSLNFNDNQFGIYIGWITFALSQMVAISAAVEEYFKFREKSTTYRKTAESLKREVWKYLQLSGSSYRQYSHHSEGYRTFALRVEKLLKEDVEAFIELAKEKSPEEEEQEKQQQENQQGRSPSSLSGVVGASGTPNASSEMRNKETA